MFLTLNEMQCSKISKSFNLHLRGRNAERYKTLTTRN